MNSTEKIFIKWLKINFLFFITTFLLVFLLVKVFPEEMLKLYGYWTDILARSGAKTSAELSSNMDFFLHILSRNALSILIAILVGIFAQGFLLIIFYGLFYALIAFLAPVTIGHSFLLPDWILISFESASLIISCTAGSLISTIAFGIEPSLTGLAQYWKMNWNQIIPKTRKNWKEELAHNKVFFLKILLIIIVLLIFVATFETWGY